MDRRLLVLALGMFALGTDSFVVAGLLPEIARLSRRHRRCRTDDDCLCPDVCPACAEHQADVAPVLRPSRDCAALPSIPGKEKCRKQNGIALTKTDDGRCSLTHAEMHVSRFSYLSSIDQASGVFNFFPSKTPPNNSMVVLVQIAP
jgi:hypothetical protein